MVSNIAIHLGYGIPEKARRKKPAKHSSPENP